MLYFYKQMSLRYELRQDNHLPEYQYIIHQGKSIDQGYLCSASTLCLRQTVQEKGSAAQRFPSAISTPLTKLSSSLQETSKITYWMTEALVLFFNALALLE
ncbi:LYR motif-containing protein 4 isoform X2 [Hyla sarda]|uniref:LYR motif-containing protein 4 isoform X2 n=1 Tax=Hyla sarda TaxID=327740 RepID=UPI0024C3D905|nr:LYR motif-containing protein 4 isoform X2 [Hyla sarda]